MPSPNYPFRFHLACGATIALGVVALAVAGLDIAREAMPPAYAVPDSLDATARQVLANQHDALRLRAQEQSGWNYGLAGARCVIGLAFVIGGWLAWQEQSLGRQLLVPAFWSGFLFVALAGAVLMSEGFQRYFVANEHYRELVETTTLGEHPAQAAELAYVAMPWGWLEIVGTAAILLGKFLCFVVGLGYFTRNDVRAWLEPPPAWFYERRPVVEPGTGNADGGLRTAD